MTEFDVTVSTGSLRAALTAVLPHAATDPDESVYYRLRLTVGVDGVTVGATDGWTTALALVTANETRGEVGCFDLSPQDAKDLLTLFRVAKDAPVAHQLQLVHDGKTLVATDVSGLFEGRQVRFEAVPLADDYPDLGRAVGAAVRAAGHLPYRIPVPAVSLGRFVVAGKAYGAVLSIEPTAVSDALLVLCGDDFVGLMVPMPGESDVYLQGIRESWEPVTHDISLSHPTPPGALVTDLTDLAAALRPPATKED
ncbi:hypothetical protein FDO65_10010 [Nakamurella flava]|uniref:DNA polymerase III beta sliding clamp central domain-containing protein n=1 Tax=Nakamurella flava TaxID=2576308 RepID=A0A4U6QN30_9ACTN|nr:hypothetical protein [Nakamurella flava]TKV61851.1 hypothetical protein FDO65_10010 [Nakamurella flava]